MLLERARLLHADAGQGDLNLGVEPTPTRTDLVAAPVVDKTLFGGDDAVPSAGRAADSGRVSTPRVVATCSRLLFDTLAGIYADLGFDAVGDETFRDLVIARIVEPTSILDVSRVLTDLGQAPASEKTMRRTLLRARQRAYRDQIASACFSHVSGGRRRLLVPLRRHHALLRGRERGRAAKGRFSKERRVDLQIVVGLLVDRRGFLLRDADLGVLPTTGWRSSTIDSTPPAP